MDGFPRLGRRTGTELVMRVVVGGGGRDDDEARAESSVTSPSSEGS